MKVQYHSKKVLLWGSILIILQMLIGNLFYMNPLVSGTYEKYEGHPAIKSFDFVGGMENWILLTMLFSILLMIFWIFLFKQLYHSLPGKGWIKGLSLGIIIAILKAIPEAFNQWMVINYPVRLILVQLANSIFGLIIFGCLMGFFFTKFKVIYYESEH